VQERNTANSVESGVVSFNSPLEESHKFLCELGIKNGAKRRNSYTDTGPGFGKSLIFQMLVLIKQIMMVKPLSAVLM